MLVMFMRDRFSPAGSDVSGHIWVKVIQLLPPAALANHEALRATVSMATSICKHMRDQPTFAAMVPDNQPLLNLLEARPILIGRLPHAIAEVVQLVNKRTCTPDSQSSMANKESSHRSRGVSTAPHIQHGREGKLSEGGGCRQAGDKSCLIPSQILQLQLQNVLLTSVVQFCHWTAGQINSAGAHERKVLVALASVSRTFQSLQYGLTEMCSQLMSVQVMILPKPQAEVGRLLGLHALKFMLMGSCPDWPPQIQGGAGAASKREDVAFSG